jgi:hypothetical protein
MPFPSFLVLGVGFTPIYLPLLLSIYIPITKVGKIGKIGINVVFIIISLNIKVGNQNRKVGNALFLKGKK